MTVHIAETQQIRDFQAYEDRKGVSEDSVFLRPGRPDRKGRHPTTKRRHWDNPGANDLRWRGPDRRVNDLAAVHEAWAEWLPLMNWDWYATFTIGDRPITSNGVWTHVRQYLHWLSRAAGVSSYAFFAEEYGAVDGRLHHHALIGRVGRIKVDCGHRAKDDQGQKCCGKHAWPIGWARVYAIDDRQPMRDLTHYLSKYVTKANGEWNLFGFPDLLQGRLLLVDVKD